MNKVLLTGRLTRDPEMRSLASGKVVTTFTVASNEFIGGGKEKAEYHPVVTWDRLAEIAGRYLGKGQQVAIEGRLQTRSWDDDRGARHWKTEVVAAHVEMLSGRKKKDYEAQQAADSLAAQASALGEAPADEPIPDTAGFEPGSARRRGRGRPRSRRRSPPDPSASIGGGARPLPRRRAFATSRYTNSKNDTARIDVDEHQERALEPGRFAVEGDERADADGRRDRGDLERCEDEVHRLADDDADQHEDRCHEEGDLQAGPEGHRHRELHLVLGRELDRDEVLGKVADGRDEHDADEERAEAERVDERLDGAHQDLRQDRQERRSGQQDHDGDLAAPRRPGVPCGLAMAAQGVLWVRELVDERDDVARS